jgi:drug/metabolite transporter (DMT)-like permease
LFGVVASYVIMDDTLTPIFGVAAVLVMAGLYLVNRPDPVVAVPTDPFLNVTKPG